MHAQPSQPLLQLTTGHLHPCKASVLLSQLQCIFIRAHADNTSAAIMHAGSSISHVSVYVVQKFNHAGMPEKASVASDSGWHIVEWLTCKNSALISLSTD